jgi:hypothetical protein
VLNTLVATAARLVAADISRNLTVDRPVVGAARIGMNVSSGQMHQNDDSRGARRRGPSSLSRLGVVNCLPAASPAKRLAERLWDGNVRRGGTSVHHLSDIAVDLVYVDDADTDLCR